eukprot:TRINITY_DN9108_c0_g1_i3.p1 TRINITY_DN9108_c0_g1~~TRINITY_DN9108_c0_g1_i3.p1  ORF type:complete len:573 (-),score=189.83 TRINITY_DN9108_c0_g1_i3:151-1869(-)
MSDTSETMMSEAPAEEAIEATEVPTSRSNESNEENRPPSQELRPTTGERDVKELEELQRKYKIMMGDRQSFQKHAKPKLRQQNEYLERLKTENEELRAKLDAQTATGGSKKRKDPMMTKLNALVVEEEKMYKARNAEAKASKELDYQIDFLVRKVLADEGKPKQLQAQQKHLQKQLIILENKLEKATVRYNEALTGNKALRSHIDDLWKEKKIYNEHTERRERLLTEKKQLIANQIDASNQAYELRDRYEHEIELIKQQTVEREHLWEQELKMLDGKLSTFRRVEELLDVQRGDLSKEEEEELHRKRRKELWALSIQKSKVLAKQTLSEQYESMFEKMREATGEADIDVIVDRFLQGEDKTFQLYTYVNNLTTDIETMEEGVREDEKELGHLVDDSRRVTSLQKETTKQIKGLEDRLVKTEAAINYYEDLLEPMQSDMDGLLAIVAEMFKQFNCEELGVEELIGMTGVIDENNVVFHLGLIEQRATEIIYAFLARHNAANAKASTTFLTQAEAAPPEEELQPEPEPEAAAEEEYGDDFEAASPIHVAPGTPPEAEVGSPGGEYEEDFEEVSP